MSASGYPRSVSGQEWIRLGLAANRSTPPDVLVELAGSGDERVQHEIISTRIGWPALEPVANILARSPHARVREQLARATYVPDEAVVRLAGDPDCKVRFQVVRRPLDVSGLPQGRRYVPDEAYAILARDENLLVAAELLGLPGTPLHVKREIGRLHEEFRDDCLLYYGEPDEARATYERLVAGEDSGKRRQALRSGRFRPPAELVSRLLADEAHRLTAIEQIPLSPGLASTLVADDDAKVRRAVAVNPDLPRDLLEVLAEDPSREVRKALAFRPYIPLALLERIDYGSDPVEYQVDWLWEQRHDVDLVAAYSWSRQLSYRLTVSRVGGLPQDVVDRLARDGHHKVRMFLAGSNGERAPVELLEEALFTNPGHSGDWVAQNPRVPDDVIERLSRSENKLHRWRACYTGRLTREQRTRLAADADPDLAAQVVPPPTPEQLVAWLHDPSPQVRDEAVRHIALPESAIRDLWAGIK